MKVTEVEAKIKNFTMSNNLEYDLITNNKKQRYDIYIKKDNILMGVSIQFKKIEPCILRSTLSDMLNKITERKRCEQ